MSKAQDKENDAHKDDKNEQDTKAKDRKKDRKALVGRVRKAVKKSRRKMSEEKFEKELRRTITFLEGLQARMAENGSGGHLQPAVILVDAEQVKTETQVEPTQPTAVANPAAF